MALKAVFQDAARRLGPIFLLGIAANALTLSYPFLLKTVMERLDANGLSGGGLVPLICLVTVLGFGVGASRDYAIGKLAARFDRKLSRLLLDKVIALPYLDLRARTTGEWLINLKRVEDLKWVFGQIGSHALFDLLLVVGYLGFLFYYQPSIALLYCGLAISMVSLMRAMSVRVCNLIEEGYFHKAQAETQVAECLRYPLSVRLYRLGGWIAGRWSPPQQSAVEAFRKSDAWGALSFSIFELARQSSPLLILAWKLPQVGHGEMTLGTAVATSTVFSLALEPFLRLSSFTAQLGKSLQGYRALDAILRLPERSAGIAPSPSGAVAVEARKLSFAYPPGNPTLHGIDFRVEAGECIGISGRSGCGKTTLFHLVAGLLAPGAGELRVQGSVGFVPQNSEIFTGTILENIALGDPTPDAARALHCAELASATEFVVQQPQGLDTRIGEGGGSLSRGQSQRIMLARALYWEPTILILDEPTSALDTVTEKALFRSFEKIRKGRTVVMAAHRLETLAVCDRILVMANGRIVQSGAHRELLSDDGAYSRLWEARFAGLSPN
jgi:ABC-type bacteriocin/lantibiotic exporter with double-glycine peptidase domain